MPAEQEAMRMEEMAEAFRYASGAAYEEQQRAKRGTINQAILPVRLALFFHTYMNENPQWEQRDQRTWGEQKLTSLLDEAGGVYPRGAITYFIRGEYDRQEFIYDLIFPGERVGEEGKVELERRTKSVWLKKGSERVIEILDGGRHALHLPEGEGIILRPRLDRFTPWGNGEWISLATWYPDLSETPQRFSHPDGGRFVWNVPK